MSDTTPALSPLTTAKRFHLRIFSPHPASFLPRTYTTSRPVSSAHFARCLRLPLAPRPTLSSLSAASSNGTMSSRSHPSRSSVSRSAAGLIPPLTRIPSDKQADAIHLYEQLLTATDGMDGSKIMLRGRWYNLLSLARNAYDAADHLCYVWQFFFFHGRPGDTPVPVRGRDPTGSKLARFYTGLATLSTLDLSSHQGRLEAVKRLEGFARRIMNHLLPARTYRPV